MSKMQALFGLGAKKDKKADPAPVAAEATKVIDMGEEEARRRRMRAATGASTILSDADKLGG